MRDNLAFLPFNDLHGVYWLETKLNSKSILIQN